jgi:hypothetical protein
MTQEKPKKPRSKKLNLSSKATWRSILKDVDKKEVPIHVLEKLMLHLKDGTVVKVDIREILKSGVDPEDVEARVNQQLQELDDYIDNVDFFVDLEQVERTVQPETDKILSKL